MGHEHLFMRVMGLFFAVFGALFILLAAAGKRKAKETLSWKTATGRILRSEILRSIDHFASGTSSTTIVAHIEYEYEVDGQTYRSARQAMVTTTGRSAAQAAVAKYPVGRHVMVFYDPATPASAVLEQDTPGSHLLFYASGAVFVLAGIGLLLA